MNTKSFFWTTQNWFSIYIHNSVSDLHLLFLCVLIKRLTLELLLAPAIVQL